MGVANMECVKFAEVSQVRNVFSNYVVAVDLDESGLRSSRFSGVLVAPIFIFPKPLSASSYASDCGYNSERGHVESLAQRMRKDWRR